MVLERSQIQNLRKASNSRIEEIARHFIEEPYISDTLLISTCPIHNGDNATAFNINIDPDDEYCGKWFCNTAKCHDDYPNDIIGFVQGNLGSFIEAVEWLQKFLGIDDDDLDGEVPEVDYITRFLARKQKKNEHLLSRRDFRKRLLIPSRYYMDRGFKPETLDYFDVGLCIETNAQMHDRVVFPVYDIDDEHVIGYVGRDVTEQSERKWINSKGFNASSYLFNYQKALESAREKGVMILCEGQGDVMRLYEAGIENAVGIFGSSLSDGQVRLLHESGCLKIILALDPDKAGQDCRKKIHEKLAELYHIEEIKLPDDRDIGDLSIEEIKELRL